MANYQIGTGQVFLGDVLSSARSLVVGYLGVRRTIGFVGLFLLPILYFAAGMKAESISHYYHTPARDVLTAALAVIGAQLLAYRGYDSNDHACASIAGLSIIGVALMPVNSAWHWGHIWCANTFFLASAALTWRFSFGTRFVKTFKTIAVMMALSAGLMAVGLPLIVGETILIVLFGIAWLLKGKILEALLKREFYPE